MPAEKETLFKLIGESVEHEKKGYEDEMYRKGVKELWRNLYCANIFKEVASMVEDDLENHFDPELDAAELQIIYDLAKRSVFLKTIHDWALGMDNLDISTYDTIAQLIQDYCEEQLHLEE